MRGPGPSPDNRAQLGGPCGAGADGESEREILEAWRLFLLCLLVGFSPFVFFFFFFHFIFCELDTV